MTDRRRIAQLERAAARPATDPARARRRAAPSEDAVRAVIAEGRRRRDTGGGFGVTLDQIRAAFDHDAMEGRHR